MDELKQALSDAEQAHIQAAQEYEQAEIAYYGALMRQAQAKGAVEVAKASLLAVVCQVEEKA